MNNEEQTLSIIKPDAVERNLQDSIKNDLKVVDLKSLKKKDSHFKNEVEQFYKVHETKPFTENCVIIYPQDP